MAYLMRVAIDEYHKENILKFWSLIKSSKKSGNQFNQDAVSDFLKGVDIPSDSIQYIQTLYDSGYGFKVLARELGLSYSQCRRFFLVYLKIKTREGRDVVTSKISDFRSQKAKSERTWNDWPKKYPHMTVNSNKGIQGYYKRKNGEKVWLRSTWEFIYAKWLDERNFNWDVESRCFNLSDGTSYRPDFFITNEDGSFFIVEVKGYFQNRLYKSDLLKKEYGINVVVIDNIKSYTNLTYSQELRLWKKQRLLN